MTRSRSELCMPRPFTKLPNVCTCNKGCTYSYYSTRTAMAGNHESSAKQCTGMVLPLVDSLAPHGDHLLDPTCT